MQYLRISNPSIQYRFDHQRRPLVTAAIILALICHEGEDTKKLHSEHKSFHNRDMLIEEDNTIYNTLNTNLRTTIETQHVLLNHLTID